MQTQDSQRIAVIDLGSNTARLIVLSTVPGYAYNLDEEIREVVRLREGMTVTGLSAKATARALVTLRLFKDFCDSLGVDEIIATATSAVRDAYNGAAFVEQVERDIGLPLRILDGELEAYYGTIGALNEVPLVEGYVVDIGGGSAQISVVQNRRFLHGASRPLGALALSEQFVSEDPLSKSTYKAIQRAIDQNLDSIEWLEDAPARPLVGLGGTIRNLARMQAMRESFPMDTLHGYIMSRAALAESIEILRHEPLEQRRKIDGLNADRADIILPGAMVVAAIMDRLQQEELAISVNGLREGLFFERFWQHLSYPVVDDVCSFGVLNTARVYSYDKKHASHVRFLCDRLFEQLMPLHGYGSDNRELLDSAALLHDLGTIIEYSGHHKHSQMLITNRGLPGYSPRETALIALLTRYHRKGNPSPGEFGSLLGKDDDVLLLRLAALLRLSEYLERGRNGNVDDITAAWDEKSLRLTIIADEYPAVEMWQAERNAAALMAEAFAREVVLESTAAPEAWVTEVPFS